MVWANFAGEKGVGHQRLGLLGDLLPQLAVKPLSPVLVRGDHPLRIEGGTVLLRTLKGHGLFKVLKTLVHAGEKSGKAAVVGVGYLSPSVHTALPPSKRLSCSGS